MPHFTIGHSLGGCLQLLTAAEEPDLFQGMTLITPFIELAPQEREKLDKLKPMARIVNMFMPAYQIKMKKEEKSWL